MGKATLWMTLSKLSKKTPMKITNSMATGFPILYVGEFVGWEELEGWPPDHLFVLGVTDRSDGVRAIRSCSHRTGSTLCVSGLFPNLLIPLPLVPRGDVGMARALSRRLQVSSSHPMAGCESLYLSICWNRCRIEPWLFFVAFVKQSFARPYSRCASVFPSRTPRRVLLLTTKYGMVSASNFCSVSRLVYFVGIKHVPHVR